MNEILNDSLFLFPSPLICIIWHVYYAMYSWESEGNEVNKQKIVTAIKISSLVYNFCIAWFSCIEN